MGEQGREWPKQHTRHKRSSGELMDSPEEVLAKRPRHEATSAEADRRNERRLKNKEAAEKSRRKKKEEFANLQTENDQLQQDKCQLVAMIGKLKSDLNKVSEENRTLRYNTDHLKRWIGKHAGDLGLGKHMQKRKAEEKAKLPRTVDTRRSGAVLRDDPSLHSTVIVVEDDQEQQLSLSSLPSLSSAPNSTALSSVTLSSCAPLVSKRAVLSAAPMVPQAVSQCSNPQLPAQDFFQPVGIRTVVSLPQLHVPVVGEQSQMNSYHNYRGQQAEMIYTGGQQLVCLPKDTVFVVQGDNGQQVMMVQQEAMKEGSDVQITTPVQQTQLFGGEAPKVQMTRVEALETQATGVEAPETQATGVEAPETQATGVEAPETQATGVEAPETQAAGVEAPETEKGSVEATEVQEGSMQVLYPPQSTVKTTEMQAVPGDSGSTKEAVQVDVGKNFVAAKEIVNATEGGMMPDSSSPCQTSLATSIETLLKLGYKIQMPDGIQLLPGVQ